MGIKKLSDGTTVITRSTSETGHAKNAAAFKQLIKGIEDLGTVYKPGNEAIQLWRLSVKDQAITEVMNNWGIALRNDENAENQRTEAFSTLNTISTRIAGILASSSNISELTIKDTQSILAKIRGSRSPGSKKAIEEAKVNGLELPATRSVSQQSYDQKLAHFIALKTLVASQANYQPAEADLSLSGLTEYENKLIAANNNMVSARSKLIDARNQRNIQLYDSTTGAIALSKAIKNYVKAIFGAQDPQYKKINGIAFRTINDKAGKL